MEPTGTQQVFEHLLSLFGKEVEIGSRRTGRIYRGKVANVMFDSVILDVANSKTVLRFDDFLFVNPLQ